ncbi:hypothetical protein V8E55_001410 [Tylopilus felleus]
MHFHRVSEQQEFRHSFSREGSSRSQGIHPRIQGDHVDPRWMDEKPAHSIPMCNVVANTSKLAHSLRAQVTPDGSVLSHKLRCHPAFWPDRIENADKLEARGPSFHCPSVDQAFMTYYLVFRARKRGENYTVTRTF